MSTLDERGWRWWSESTGQNGSPRILTMNGNTADGRYTIFVTIRQASPHVPAVISAQRWPRYHLDPQAVVTVSVETVATADELAEFWRRYHAFGSPSTIQLLQLAAVPQPLAA